MLGLAADNPEGLPSNFGNFSYDVAIISHILYGTGDLLLVHTAKLILTLFLKKSSENKNGDLTSAPTILKLLYKAPNSVRAFS
jgi:hypothetical protein